MISREEAKQAIIDTGLKLIENPDTGQMWGVIDDIPGMPRMHVCSWSSTQDKAYCYCSVYPVFTMTPYEHMYSTDINNWITFKDINSIKYAKDSQMESLYRHQKNAHIRDIEYALETL